MRFKALIFFAVIDYIICDLNAGTVLMLLSVSERQKRVCYISSHGLLNGVFVMSVSATQQCNLYLGLWSVMAERLSTMGGTSQKTGRNDRVWGRSTLGRIDHKPKICIHFQQG